MIIIEKVRFDGDLVAEAVPDPGVGAAGGALGNVPREPELLRVVQGEEVLRQHRGTQEDVVVEVNELLRNTL